MNYSVVARDIISCVGGKENIKSAQHCATRLRLVLKDKNIVDEKGLEEIDAVKGTFYTNGQYQIILGSGVVNLVCEEVIKQANLNSENKNSKEDEEVKQEGNLLQRAVKGLSDIFVPIIPAIVAGGLMMGLYNVLTAAFFAGGKSIIDLYPQFAGMASMINLFSNAAFTFLPVLLGFSASKKFGGNPYLGAAMGMIMVHPELLNAYAVGTATEIPYWDIFGLHIAMAGYQGTVLPVLAVAWIMSTIEKRLHKITPSWLDNLTTPLLTTLITGFVTFLFIGPIMRSAGDYLADGLSWMYNTLGFVGGGLFGLLYAPITMTGMHHSFIAVETQLIAAKATTGGSFIFPTASMNNIAQGAAVLAVLWITKNEKMKSVCSAAGISALLGITEPAMFGVTLKLRYPFIAAIIGTACGSAFLAAFHVLAIAQGAAGIPGFISIPIQNWGFFAIGGIISFVVAFGLTFILAKRDAIKNGKAKEAAEEEDAAEKMLEANGIEEVKEEKIYSPMNGVVKDIENSSDEAFSSKAMGDGVVITEHDGNVYSPVDGEVVFTFPTGHACGIKSDAGAEILIHCGIDTVKLEGNGFDTNLESMQKVKKGDLLISFDKNFVEKSGYSSEVLMVITGSEKDLELKKQGECSTEDIIFE